MTITTRRGCLVLAVSGELDLGMHTGFVEAARQSLHAAAGRPLVVDLSALTFLSSTGLGHLVSLDTQAQTLGTPLRIVVGDAWAVFGPFAVLGLDQVLSLFRTVDDAVDVAGRCGDRRGSAVADPA